MTSEERLALVTVNLRLLGVHPEWIPELLEWYGIDTLENFVNVLGSRNGFMPAVYRRAPDRGRVRE